jgi:hypothetical protein
MNTSALRTTAAVGGAVCPNDGGAASSLASPVGDAGASLPGDPGELETDGESESDD